MAGVETNGFLNFIWTSQQNLFNNYTQITQQLQDSPEKIAQATTVYNRYAPAYTAMNETTAKDTENWFSFNSAWKSIRV